MTRLETLQNNLHTVFGADANVTISLNEVTLEIPAEKWVDACTTLRDHASLRFETCIDLCGLDYSAWGAPTYTEASS